MLEGQCLCGAITVRANSAAALRACHCDMCRKHTSSMFMSVELDQHSLEIEGDVATYRSSEWAERGFCSTCGSTIFYATVHDGRRNLAAGLFADAAKAPLTQEFYADTCPDSYTLLDRGQQKLTTAQTIALFTGGDA